MSALHLKVICDFNTDAEHCYAPLRLAFVYVFYCLTVWSPCMMLLKGAMALRHLTPGMFDTYTTLAR